MSEENKDFKELAFEEFEKSIKLARECGVSENQILKNDDDIFKFFNE